MHLIVLIQESLPSTKHEGNIGKFIDKISQKEYTAPFVSSAWSRIRARELKIFDFTIPESCEEEVLKDLACYACGKLQKLSKIASHPLLKGIITKKLGIKPIDMDKYRVILSETGEKRSATSPVYLTILGKIDDGYTEDGVELL